MCTAKLLCNALKRILKIEFSSLTARNPSGTPSNPYKEMINSAYTQHFTIESKLLLSLWRFKSFLLLLSLYSAKARTDVSCAKSSVLLCSSIYISRIFISSFLHVLRALYIKIRISLLLKINNARCTQVKYFVDKQRTVLTGLNI